MKHVNNFDEWKPVNEYDMSTLFQSIHSAINPINLKKVTDLIGTEKFPTKAEFDEVVNYLGIDPEYVYYDKGSVVSPFIYWKDSLLFEFPAGFDMKAIMMFRSKEAIEYRLKKFADCKKKNDYMTLFFLTEKRILIPMFNKLYKEIPDSQKYDVFVEMYVRSEYGFEMMPKEIISDVYEKRHLSNAWKKRMVAFKKEAKLNDDGTLTIYRGENTKSVKQEEAYSWSLSKKTAGFFATRFSKGTGRIISKNVKPDEVLDLLGQRGESEVLIMPDKWK